jgi:hypothetical protein
MTGHNPLWVAQQQGNTLVIMLIVHAAWTEGTLETDVAAIPASTHSVRRRYCDNTLRTACTPAYTDGSVRPLFCLPFQVFA